MLSLVRAPRLEKEFICRLRLKLEGVGTGWSLPVIIEDDVLVGGGAEYTKARLCVKELSLSAGTLLTGANPGLRSC
jgi:hypothetical protein